MFSRFFSIFVSILLIPGIFAEEMVYITIGSDALPILSKNKILTSKSLKSEKGISLLQVPQSEILKISELMHKNFHRCGGFIYYPNLESAKEAFIEPSENKNNLAEYSIDQEIVVNSYLKKVNSEYILNTIKKLSSYQNRYFQSHLGVDSQSWIKSNWESIIKNYENARVENFTHEYIQPSVILTIQGSKYPDDIIVLGGHGDSISNDRGNNNEKNAPGADDNASGIAVLTEIIRVLASEGYRPEKTIKFISYAAEEVGLRGSNEIARRMKSTNSKVIGVLQFDMTNFIGPDGKINLISDFTNQNQNVFLGKLIDKYVQSPWTFSKCGYACSDHASWTNSGFAASFPFESSVNGSNPHLHTKEDTLDKSNNTAEHAMKFAKLGISYLIELDR